MKFKITLFIFLIFVFGYKANAEYYPAQSQYGDYKNIAVQQPIPLSYKTKAEIYAVRKNAVKNSIFKNDNYEPSQYVFGQIEDRKPWISMNSCILHNDKRSIITGPSEESRFILNPSALVQINWPFAEWCEKGENRPHLHLKSIKYSESKKEIIVVYDRLNVITSNNSYFELCGINARDLGYRYAFVDKSKSTYNLIFTEQNNISTNIAEFQNFIHTGMSCKHAGGCNNASPIQPMLNFKNSHQVGTPYQRNKEIYIKLWKNKPNSPNDAPDITERIIIESA